MAKLTLEYRRGKRRHSLYFVTYKGIAHYLAEQASKSRIHDVKIEEARF